MLFFCQNLPLPIPNLSSHGPRSSRILCATLETPNFLSEKPGGWVGGFIFKILRSTLPHRQKRIISILEIRFPKLSFGGRFIDTVVYFVRTSLHTILLKPKKSFFLIFFFPFNFRLVNGMFLDSIFLLKQTHQTSKQHKELILVLKRDLKYRRINQGGSQTKIRIFANNKQQVQISKNEPRSKQLNVLHASDRW